jgi:hypothetical protein
MEGSAMKTSWMMNAALVTAVAVSPRPAAGSAVITNGAMNSRSIMADTQTTPPEARLKRSDWSGPRMGFMFAPGDPAISRRLRANGLGTMVSQFGWQFERRIAAFSGGPQLVTEVVPLFGGVEYNKLVPSVNAVVGVRFKSGYEFGMGPSLSVTSISGGPSTGLVIAAGKSIDYGDVCIPVNLALSTNPKGTMVNVLVGYSINKAAQ